MVITQSSVRGIMHSRGFHLDSGFLHHQQLPVTLSGLAELKTFKFLFFNPWAFILYSNFLFYNQAYIILLEDLT